MAAPPRWPLRPRSSCYVSFGSALCHQLTLPDFLPRYLQTIERALEAGDVVLIENLEESVDPVLGPLLGREVIKKGRYDLAMLLILCEELDGSPR